MMDGSRQGSDRIRIALLQSAPSSDGLEGRLSALEEVLREASKQNVDLLLTPELYLCGYGIATATRMAATELISAPIASAAEIAKRHRVGVVIGYPEKLGNEIFNSAVYIDAEGEIVTNYRKLFLANDYERECFSRGHRFSLFRIGAFRAAIIICFDIEFPEVVREAARLGAEVIFVPTALQARWKIVSSTVVSTRGYENGVYIAYCNYGQSDSNTYFAGLSTVCGPDGEVISKAGLGSEVICADLDRSSITSMRKNFDFLSEISENLRVWF